VVEEATTSLGRCEHFEIRSELGNGAQGTVYKAFNTTSQTETCLKVSNNRLDSTVYFFNREVQIASQLAVHPNILRPISCGLGMLRLANEDAREVLFIESPLCEGGDLFTKVKATDGIGLPEAEAREIFH
jgi:serine/threonine protein kinase